MSIITFSLGRFTCFLLRYLYPWISEPLPSIRFTPCYNSHYRSHVTISNAHLFQASVSCFFPDPNPKLLVAFSWYFCLFQRRLFLYGLMSVSKLSQFNLPVTFFLYHVFVSTLSFIKMIIRNCMYVCIVLDNTIIFRLYALHRQSYDLQIMIISNHNSIQLTSVWHTKCNVVIILQMVSTVLTFYSFSSIKLLYA